MKTLVLLLLILLPFLSFSQRNKQNTYDSSRYYEKEITKAYKATFDSLKATDLFVRYLQHQRRNNNYVAAVIFFNLLHSDYAAFNKSIAANGFPAFSPMSFGMGFGIVSKTQHILFDFYAVSGSFQNPSKKGDEQISSTLGNMLQLDLGYDILHSSKMSIYPYAGLSLRIATLHYFKKGSVNPVYTNISDFVTNSQSTYASSVRLGYQAGVGLDFTLSNNKKGDQAVILFAKAGINQPMVKDIYKFNGTKYDPGINKGDWMVSIGFKFANRYNR